MLWLYSSLYNSCIAHNKIIFFISYPNILWPKQELTIQIGPLNWIHVGHCDVPALSSTKANQGKVFQKLTANGTSTHLILHKCFGSNNYYMDIV